MLGTSKPRQSRGAYEVLLVEDERIARHELSRTLINSGFRVRQASSGRGAIRQAGSGKIGVVLMDIVLGKGPDGIEAAQKIQRRSPYTSFIFVTAYAKDPEYRERVQRGQLRVADWIEKPVQPMISRLVKSVAGEIERYGRLEAEQRNQDFQGQEVEELHASLGSEAEIEQGIAKTYEEMRALVLSRAGDPKLGEALHALQKRLAILQSREADLIEERFLMHFKFDDSRGDSLIRRIQRSLRKL